VYVDNKGRRSRQADMKWSCLPLSLGMLLFIYRTVDDLTFDIYKLNIYETSSKNVI